MPTSSADRNPVDELAEEFAERYRRGERPPLTEYTAKYPQWADEIRELFPALVMMEEFKPKAGEATGDYAVPDANRPPLERLGDYRILREVGRGGMGIVYEAEQESLGRHVALKVMPRHSLLDPQRLRRFQREARAAARLHHTNIVPVFGVAEHERLHYYVMQFIQGESLDKVLGELRRLRAGSESRAARSERKDGTLTVSIARGLLTGCYAECPPIEFPPAPEENPTPCSPAPGPIPLSCSPSTLALTQSTDGGIRSVTISRSSPGTGSERDYFRTVARLGVQVASALEHAHGQGVLHRDIKPSNLLLDLDGTVWVADFGLAKTEGADALTHTGDIVGTFRYMAPERFQGASDQRSDVYGLGVTLYEMLTLQPAFPDSDRARLVERVTHADPPRPRQLDSTVPRDLETIVLKAIAKEPRDRYQTATEFSEDLRRFLADRPIRARRTPGHERVWRWCRRNPAVAGLLGMVAILLVTVATVSTILAAQLNSALGETKAKAAEREGRLREAEGLGGQAHGTRFSRNRGRQVESLAFLKKAAAIGRELDQPAEWFDRLRNEAIACMALLDLHLAQEWSGYPRGSFHVDFDDALERYARSDKQGAVSVRRVSDDAELCRLEGLNGSNHVLMSPNGRYVASGSAGVLLKIWWLPDGLQPVVKKEAKNCSTCAFSPDSRQAAVGYGDGSVEVYDPASGQVQRRLEVGGVPKFLAFHPKEQRLAVASPRGVHVYDLESGKELTTLKELTNCGHLAWHPDGAILGVAENTISLWDVAGGRQVVKMEGYKGDGIRFAFNHSGDLLAAGGWESELRLWDSRTGKLLFSTQGGIHNVRFRSDDRLLAGQQFGNKLRIWEVLPTPAFRRVVRDAAPRDIGYETISFSPKAPLLAAGAEDGFGLWDPRNGKQLAFIHQSGKHVAFDPSGAVLTNGSAGLLRWPVRLDEAAPEVMRIGPPQKLPLGGTSCQIACSRDGKVIASAGIPHHGAFVLHTDDPQHILHLDHEDVRQIAVSPDGRFAATGSHGASHVVKVWDAVSGKLEKELAGGGGAHVAFSPDGDWLATGGERLRVWQMESWQEHFALEDPSGAIAFSPDNKMLAFETGYGVIRLIEPGSGRDWGRLENPEQHRSAWLCFSPDGTRLAASAQDGQTIHIWDLRVIRERLAAMGLDWDLPPFPAVVPDAPPAPIQVQVDKGHLGNPQLPTNATPEEKVEFYTSALDFDPENTEAYHRRAHAYEALGKYREAIVDFTEALKRRPDNTHFLVYRASDHARLQHFQEALTDFRAALDRNPMHAETCNAFAWFLATGPASQRNAKEALTLAERAVNAEPGNCSYQNTLGVALYRNDQIERAIGALEASLKSAQGKSDAFNLFFLAMCHAKLGDPPKAKDCFDCAVKWVEGQKTLQPAAAEELRTFRAEAEQAMVQK